MLIISYSLIACGLMSAGALAVSQGELSVRRLITVSMCLAAAPASAQSTGDPASKPPLESSRTSSDEAPDRDAKPDAALDPAAIAAAQAAVTSALPDLPAGTNVIVFRRHAEPLVWATTVKVDGRRVAAIGQHQYLALHLPPGQHSISLSWSFLSGQSGGGMEVVTQEGSPPHFLEVLGTSRYAGGGFGYMLFRMGSGIAEAEPAAAAAAVANCCHLKPVSN